MNLAHYIKISFVFASIVFTACGGDASENLHDGTPSTETAGSSGTCTNCNTATGGAAGSTVITAGSAGTAGSTTVTGDSGTVSTACTCNADCGCGHVCANGACVSTGVAVENCADAGTTVTGDSGTTNSDAGTVVVTGDSGTTPANDAGTAVDSGWSYWRNGDSGAWWPNNCHPGLAVFPVCWGETCGNGATNWPVCTLPKNDAGTDSGTGDAGTVVTADSGTGSTLGTLVLHVLSPVQGLAHVITIQAQELPYRAGGVQWGSPQADFTSSTSALSATMTVVKGSQLKSNGEYDPSASAPWAHALCVVDPSSPTGARVTATVWATFNGSTTVPIVAKAHANNDGGCDLWVTADAAPAGTDDADGDGFTAHNANLALRDCDDHNGAVHPGQVESWNDSIDYDCNGNVDPATVKIVSFASTNGAAPSVYVDGALIPMTWNGGQNRYETASIPKTAAPSEYMSQWPQGSSICNGFPYLGNCYDVSFYDGICHSNNTTQMINDDGTLVPQTVQVRNSPANPTCRDVAAL